MGKKTKVILCFIFLLGVIITSYFLYFYKINSLVESTLIWFLIATFFLIMIPPFIDRRFLFCTNCYSGKLFYYPIELTQAKEMDFKCSKCHNPMDWRELPEDLYKLSVRNHRIGVAQFYNLIFFLILYDLYSLTTAYKFFMYLLIGSFIGIIISMIIIFLMTKRKILKRVQKSLLLWRLDYLMLCLIIDGAQFWITPLEKWIKDLEVLTIKILF